MGDGKWARVYGSASTVAAFDDAGKMYLWGNNNKGALGQNDTVNRSSPVQVGSDTNWVQAQMGNVGETYAIKQL